MNESCVRFHSKRILKELFLSLFTFIFFLFSYYPLHRIILFGLLFSRALIVCANISFIRTRTQRKRKARKEKFIHVVWSDEFSFPCFAFRCSFLCGEDIFCSYFINFFLLYEGAIIIKKNDVNFFLDSQKCFFSIKKWFAQQWGKVNTHESIT